MHRRSALFRLALLPSLPWTLSACGGASSSANSAEANRVRAAIGHINTLAPQWLQRTGVPGLSIAVVYRGQTWHAAGYGLRRSDGGEGVDADTVFQLASISKPIAATVMAAQMHSANGLSWDTPMAELMPGFELRYPDPQTLAQLTLGDLFAHRSGLPDHAGDMLEDLGYTRAEILQRLRFARLNAYGGYDYTNFGLTAAAQAVADAAGQDWAQLSQASLYQVLGMHNTSSRFADFAGQSNRAWGHIQTGVNYDNYGAFPAQYAVQNPPRQPDAQSPAGGVSASAQDIAQWMKLILAGGKWQGRQLLSATALQNALTPRPGGNYGYGFNIGADPYGHASISHSGAFILGASTAFILWPEMQLGIAVLTNAQPRGLAEALALSFGERAWGEVADGESGRDWLAAMQPKMHDLYKPLGSLAKQQPPASPSAAQPLSAYTGRYSNDYWGEASITITPDGDALKLILGAAHITYELRHWDGDTFVFSPKGESVSPGSVSALEFGINQLQIELFHEDLANGVFQRIGA